jgi:integrase
LLVFGSHWVIDTHVKRDKTPHVKPVKIGGYTRYRLTFWTAEGRHREHYSTPKGADDRLAELAKERKRFGEAVQNMPPALRADAISAAEILRGTGYTLVEAARAMVRSLNKEGDGVELREAVRQFLATRTDNKPTAAAEQQLATAKKKKRGGRERSALSPYQRDLAAKLEQFAQFHEGRLLSSLKMDDCQRFLNGISALRDATTVVNYRTALSMFFKYAVAREWCAINPVQLTRKPPDMPTNIVILSPAEAEAVLRACDPEIAPGVALQLFCGVRAAEIARLDWSAVQRNEMETKDGRRRGTRVFYTLTITAQTSKKHIGRRVAEIPDCALSWLGLDKKRTGNIWPSKERARDLWTLARIRAGYGPYFTDFQPAKDAQLDKDGTPRKDLRPWPDNALRRSAISYHLASTNDLPKVAYQAGNSPAVIQKFYNGVALPQDAAKFYKITR